MTCRLCATELVPSGDGAGSDEVCDRCRSLRELGRLLRQPGFLVLSHSQPQVDVAPSAPSPGLVAPPPPGTDTEPVVAAVPDAPAPADREQSGATGWQAAPSALGLRVTVLPATDAPPDRQAERLLHALPPRGRATVLRLNEIAGGWAELQQLARTDRPPRHRLASAHRRSRIAWRPGGPPILGPACAGCADRCVLTQRRGQRAASSRGRPRPGGGAGDEC